MHLRSVLAAAASSATVVTALAGLTTTALAADQIKIGLVNPLSGPISPPGVEGKRGFDLALEHLGGKIGGLPAKVTVIDDKTNPAEAVQAASKLIDEVKVDFVTGFAASNTTIPVAKTYSDAGVFGLVGLAGALQFAGKDCLPNWFVVSASSDDQPTIVGQYMTDHHVGHAYFIAADYQAGYDHLAAAMKTYKGKVTGPVYTPLTQLDFAPDLAKIRAEKPDAVFAFMVGPGAVAFAKQYAQANLQIPLYSEDPTANPLTFPAIGDAAIGILMGAAWYPGIDNPENKKFVSAFVAKYNREPAVFAAYMYDIVMLMDSAVRAVGGKIEDKDAVRAALRKADFKSVRGKFRFNNNQYPIQDLYIVTPEKDAGGVMRLNIKEKAGTDVEDGYHDQCKMKW